MIRIERTIGICMIGISIVGLSAGCGDGGSPTILGSSTTGTTAGTVATSSTTGGTSSSASGTTSSSGTSSSTTGTPTTGGSTGPLTYIAATPSATGQYTAGQTSLQFAATPTKTVYARGEPVNFTFTVANTGQQTVSTLIGVPYDFQVLQGSKVVYWLSRDPNLGSGGCCITGPTLAPGQSMTYSPPQAGNWSQTDLQGNQVAPGQYTLLVYWLPATVNGSSTYDSGQTRTNPGTIATLLGAKPVTITLQ